MPVICLSELTHFIPEYDSITVRSSLFHNTVIRLKADGKEIRSHGFFSPNGITTQKKKGGALVGEVLIIPSELFKMLCPICITNSIFEMTGDE